MSTARKVFHILNLILRGIIIALIVLFTVYNVYVLYQRSAKGNAMPTVFGYASAVVVSGSMDTGKNPDTDISVNDIVIVKAQSEYAVGDVVTFRDRTGNFTTHRIIRIGAENGERVYITKGDANNTEDGGIAASAIVGKVVNVLHGAGSAVAFLQSPVGLLTIIICGVVIWLASAGISALLRKAASKKCETPEGDNKVEVGVDRGEKHHDDEGKT